MQEQEESGGRSRGGGARVTTTGAFSSPHVRDFRVSGVKIGLLYVRHVTQNSGRRDGVGGPSVYVVWARSLRLRKHSFSLFSRESGR